MTLTPPPSEVEHRWFVSLSVRQGVWEYVPQCTCGWKGKAQRQEWKIKNLENKTAPEGRAAVQAYNHSRAARGA